MTNATDRHDRDETPIIGYLLYVIILCGLISAVGIMWGITQDQNWHGFAGAVTIAAHVI